MPRIEGKNQNSKRNVDFGNKKVVDNFCRCLTMLEKTLDRLARQHWFNPTQYPEMFVAIKGVIESVRAWIDTYRFFSGLPVFQTLLTAFVTTIGEQIALLIEVSRSAPGKKEVQKSLRLKQQQKLYNSIRSILGHLAQYPEKLYPLETQITEEAEKALIASFNNHCVKKYERYRRKFISCRGDKTFVFPCSDPHEYEILVRDPNQFRLKVVSKLGELRDRNGHKPDCKDDKKYKMRGFRTLTRKVVMPGGKVHEFPVRMVECVECGQRFSVIPSFIPREKHFSIEIIGQVLRDVVLFATSINGVIENVTNLCGRKIGSKQTVFNWVRWMGAHHPATLLTRAGLTGSGYFQEDEGFEKEPSLRTYSVVMVDPKDMTVWHIDYIDRVDEETLTSSFEEFVKKIDFKVLGVTKDKWKPATNAIKNVFQRVWIGFCHLHCLKKMSLVLSAYQKETKCPKKTIRILYKKYRDVLKTASSAGSMRAKLKYLDDKAFEHPLLKARIDELRDNAVQYTTHKNRNGITLTTSKVDNFLKIIKRKLRQVESFRDKDYTKFFFNAAANIRNFVPFMSGAKNAHKSPFMIGGGKTYGLPWIQTMNMHDAFLFTPSCDLTAPMVK